VARHNRRDDVLPVLEALLQAGADPNAPWDNGLTMLMRVEPEVAKVLLAHGADVHRRNALGQTALHVTGSAEMVRLLASHGADVNALSTSKKIVARTPLHAQLIRRPLTGAEVDQLPQMRWEIVRTLVELGADPKLRDGAGRSTLAYCDTVEDFELIRGYGLDPFERLPDGGTLLHLLTARAHRLSGEYGTLFRHLLKLGLDINAVDGQGRTALHLKAQGPYTEPEDIETMLAAGADKSIRDRKGLRAYDYVPRSGTDVRKRLVVAQQGNPPRSPKRKL
jgi:ankyrin repeat protein